MASSPKSHALFTPIRCNYLSRAQHTVRLVDYTPYPYVMNNVHLEFVLKGEEAFVTSTLQVKPVRSQSVKDTQLVLDGDGEFLTLQGVFINGRELLEGKDMIKGPTTLTINGISEACELVVKTRFTPKENTELAGLYVSGGNYCTQCEAEGFRRITYFPDRPDVMSIYTTTIHADAQLCPVLLSNGNLTSEGVSPIDPELHTATWHDPWRKPSYLFALVAGDLVATRDTFNTCSGKNVDLVIWTDSHNKHLTRHAMESLKRAMKWDEERFGLEYDLDLFNIVAVDDFNMGAMENKSLNIFNSRLVLASPDTATDLSYEQIESVVGHEYFHNWTGNRITCRDWFQLSLKEGLTVFRDQEFTSDLHSRSVARINDVRNLRSRQFAEDSSGMSHPVRPASYQKIDNFYTSTVYEKGAEVIRMYHTLMGEENFRKGMDLYFEEHDGQACTTDDYLNVMKRVSPVSLNGFERWYSQAGTPILNARTTYLPDTRQLKISLEQVLSPSPEAHPVDQIGPQFIPVAVGILDERGNDVPLTTYQYKDESGGAVSEHTKPGTTTAVLPFKTFTNEFVIDNISSEPAAVSLLRGFSAPVVLRYDQSTEELIHQAANDNDAFNRYESIQKLARLSISASYYDETPYDTNYERALARAHSTALQGDLSTLETVTAIDPATVSQMLSVPSIQELGQLLVTNITDKPKSLLLDPLRLNESRGNVINGVAQETEALLLDTYERCEKALAELSYEPRGRQTGLRSLKGQSITRLVALDPETYAPVALQMFNRASNLTEEMMSMTALSHTDTAERVESLARFHDRWKNEQLNVIGWLSVQARSEIKNNVDRVSALMSHPSFDIRTPNKVYALLGGFSTSPPNFHARDGSGYRFLADAVLEVDKLNAQVSARLLSPFTTASNYTLEYGEAISSQLQRLARSNLSANASEIVDKALLSLEKQL
eukprot:CFRG8128T1